MLVFEYILIMLALVCLSNVVNRFVPIVPVPIMQIALGAAVTFLPFGFHFHLESDLFFVLFVAPLIFYVSMLVDKKTMWSQRKPILNMGIILVFITVVAMGYLVNFLIPTIPLAAAFALIAALGPTDDVAVASVSKQVNVPPKIMNILQGESISNDASGIVCFQFALAAMLTGEFSLLHATERFFIVAAGGIAVGLALTWFKYIFVQWIRSLGMENVTLHLLLGILTPFVVYMIAEWCAVSGILAIFASGIAHSFNRDKFNPETANLNTSSQSVWEMLTFTLEGLVFVMLGTQLPQILSSINQHFSISTGEIIVYILLITTLFLLLRFAWAMFFVKKKTYDDPQYPVSRFRAGLIFSLSGARGAVTLACVMSIPLFLTDGTAFPERDLIILIAGGVIVISLIITSFILPLCVDKKINTNKEAENEAYLEILQNVITELRKRVTSENKIAVAIIIANYHRRSAELQRKQHFTTNREEERELRLTICEWEKENVVKMFQNGETDEYTAHHYLDILEVFENRLLKKRFLLRKNLLRHLYNNWKMGRNNKNIELRASVFALMRSNLQFVLEKLKQMSLTDDSPVIQKVMADCEARLSMSQKHASHSEVNDELLASIASHGFQIERDSIHAMHEQGRISRETAKEMRHNISLLEVQLRKEYF